MKFDKARVDGSVPSTRTQAADQVPGTSHNNMQFDDPLPTRLSVSAEDSGITKLTH